MASQRHDSARELGEGTLGIELPDFVVAVLARLTNDLSSKIFYHNIAHTRRVMRVADELARESGCTIEQRRLIQIAAAFHDAGFLIATDKHEAASIFLLRDYATSGLSAEDSLVVEQLISDTTLLSGEGSCQNVGHDLSCYLLDADLSGFGESDFLSDMRALNAEEEARDWATFCCETLRLLERHDWLTPAARRRFEEGKQRNMQILRNLCKAYR